LNQACGVRDFGSIPEHPFARVAQVCPGVEDPCIFFVSELLLNKLLDLLLGSSSKVHSGE
jgi:hypothetical protein